MSEPPRYTNPPLPEGINVSSTHPLADFARLLGGVAVVAVAVVGVLTVAAGHLARFVPFSAEAAAVQRFERVFPEAGGGPVEPWLRDLTARITAASRLPPGMTVTVHYVREPTVNAFATLGGHVVMYAGLLEKLESENAVAMVLAHEVAHVKLRHPASTLGRGLVLGLALTLVSTATGSDMVGNALGPAGLLTVLSFSRSQEREADEAAVGVLAALYGHTGGAADLFRVIEAQRTGGSPPAFLATHPLDAERIAAVESTARAQGWPITGAMRPVPADVRAAVRGVAERPASGVVD
jgi:predicted Zn-dependent protease